MNQPTQSHLSSTTLPAERETEGQAPLVRICLLGAFHLEWQVPPATHEALWKSRTSARTLLKLLLCAPGRQAPKSVLAGIIWPDSEEEKARESLRQATAVLRKMLRSAAGEELLLHPNDGALLKLAEQTRLWADVDAFEFLVAQASRATMPDEAIHCWQEAYALLQGDLLTEDQASEWVRHGWVKRRKQSMWLARCRLIRHLADAYVQRGQELLAEELLEQHLVRFPTDQDALYRLLILLEQHGCYEQASVMYEQAKRSLQAVGKQPNRQVNACYERMQAAVSSQPLSPLSQSTNSNSPTARGTLEHAAPSAFGTPVYAQESSVTALMSTTMQGLALLTGEGQVPGSTVTLHALRTLLEGEERQGGSLLSRLQFLELGIAALLTRLAQLDSTRLSAVEREELGQILGQSIADGWKLFLTRANAEVLAVSQFQLALIHQAHPLLYPLTRSYLYAGAYGLVGLALHHQNRNVEALQAYHHAQLASVATRDPWYVAQNLICQADTYLSLGMYTEALHVIEEALLGLGEIEAEHRRARAHLLGCWADVAMTMGEFSLAQKKLDEAVRYLDETTIVEEFDRICWLQLTGKKALMAGDYQQAIDHLEAALASNPPHWLLRQVGILTPLAIAYARNQEREKSLMIAQQALPALSAVNASMTTTHFLEYVKHDILARYPNDTKSHAFLAEVQRQWPQLVGPA